MEWGVRFAMIAVAALVLAVLARTNIVRGASGRFLSWIESPFTIVSDAVGNQGAVVFSSRQELIAELQEREEQVLQLAKIAARWEQAEQERDQALLFLGYKSGSSEIMVPAKIRVRSSIRDSDSVLIDKGAVDGIKTQQAVITGDGALYGLVGEVFAQTARVVRLTDPTVVLGGRLLDSEQTLGVMEGGFGPVVRMAYVAQDTDVHLNDVIVTSGVDPFVPAGIVIGLVNAIEEDPNAPFLTLYVEPLAQVQKTRLVGVIQSPL